MKTLQLITLTLLISGCNHSMQEGSGNLDTGARGGSTVGQDRAQVPSGVTNGAPQTNETPPLREPANTKKPGYASPSPSASPAAGQSTGH